MLIQYKNKEIELIYDEEGRITNFASIIKENGLRLLGYILAHDIIPISKEDTRKILSIIVNHVMGQLNLLNDEQKIESNFLSESESSDNIILERAQEVRKILDEIQINKILEK